MHTPFFALPFPLPGALLIDLGVFLETKGLNEKRLKMLSNFNSADIVTVVSFCLYFVGLFAAALADVTCFW